MNLSDYEAIWKRQELPVGAEADLAKLKDTFESKRRKLAATLFLRDVTESSAGLAVAVVFGHKGWQMGPAGWPIAVSVALLVGISVFFVRERIRARRIHVGGEAPMLVKLEADIAELQHQRRLLLHVDLWYLAPCLAALVIFAATLGQHAPAASPKDHLFQAGYWLFVVYLYWHIRKLNHRAVRLQIEPRLEELRKLRADLLTAN